jgi:hypothetical protein
MAKDSELREHELNALELVTAWLKFFCSATTQMSVTKQPMFSTTHTIFRALEQQLKSIISGLPASADPDLKQGLTAFRPLHGPGPSLAQGAPEASWPSATDPREDIVHCGLLTCWISTKQSISKATVGIQIVEILTIDRSCVLPAE